MSQNNPNWVPPWHSSSLTPSQCFCSSRKTFSARKRERVKKWERPLYLLSVFLSSLFTSSPLHHLCSLLSLSPSFTPLSQPSSPSSPSLPPTPLLSLVLPCACPFAPLLKLSWFREVADLLEAFWLSSWYCRIMELVARQEKALESSADAQQGIRKSLWYRDAQQGIRMPLWYRHQVLVYVQDLRRSCRQHGSVCIGKTGHGYSLPMVYQHLSGSWAPESYSRNYRHSLPVLRTGWDELYPEKEGLCPISAPQCKAGPVWI